MTVSVEKIDANVLAARKAYHRVNDAVSQHLDTSVVREDDIFERVRYVDFYRYCDVELDELMAYLDNRVPWLRPTDTGRSTNCLINDVGIYVHKKRQGYHNYALPYSWDVRMGHKTRAAALEELDDDINEEDVHRILNEIGFADDVDEPTPPPILAAFFVANSQVDIHALRDRLKSKLPDVMVPSRFVEIEEMPLTRNGKIDRDVLVLPDVTRDDIATEYVAPANEAEEVMSAIWSSVLKVDRVGATDDFYELGGDSISAIQIIARAQQRGFTFSLTSVLECRCVRNLVAKGGSTSLKQKRLVGPTPLTPAQHWLFAVNSTPDRFLNVVDCITPANMTLETLQASFEKLVAHHDALRLSFEQKNGAWLASMHERATLSQITVVAGDGPADALSAEVRAWLTAPFDLSIPPLVRVLAVKEEDAITRLVICAHHLIVDAVSWSILLDDLETAHDAVVKRREAVLPQSMSNLSGWVELLGQQTAEIHERKFWNNIVGSEAQSLVLTAGYSTAPVKSAFSLSVNETTKLLSSAPRWRIGVDELITAAVVKTFYKTPSVTPVRLFIERHGRESAREGVDATRLVGWLTSLHPVLVDVQGAQSLIDVAIATKDAFRAARRGGVGYGALKYLSSNDGASNLADLDQSTHLLVNQFGRLDFGGDKIRMQRSIELIRENKGGGFALEVNSMIEGGLLRVELNSPLGKFTKETLESVTRQVDDNLESMILAFERAESAPVSAGDFPLAGLDRAALDDLAAMLGSEGEN